MAVVLLASKPYHTNQFRTTEKGEGKMGDESKELVSDEVLDKFFNQNKDALERFILEQEPAKFEPHAIFLLEEIGSFKRFVDIESLETVTNIERYMEVLAERFCLRGHIPLACIMAVEGTMKVVVVDREELTEEEEVVEARYQASKVKGKDVLLFDMVSFDGRHCHAIYDISYNNNGKMAISQTNEGEEKGGIVAANPLMSAFYGSAKNTLGKFLEEDQHG